jgi:hypothetical protein
MERGISAGVNDSEAVLNAQKGMVDEIMSKASHLPEEDRPPRAAFTRYFPQDKRVEWLLYLSHMVEGVRPHETGGKDVSRTADGSARFGGCTGDRQRDCDCVRPADWFWRVSKCGESVAGSGDQGGASI